MFKVSAATVQFDCAAPSRLKRKLRTLVSGTAWSRAASVDGGVPSRQKNFALSAIQTLPVCLAVPVYDLHDPFEGWFTWDCHSQVMCPRTAGRRTSSSRQWEKTDQRIFGQPLQQWFGTRTYRAADGRQPCRTPRGIPKFSGMRPFTTTVGLSWMYYRTRTIHKNPESRPASSSVSKRKSWATRLKA